MDLTEAARRVLLHHLRLITVCTLLGIAAGLMIATIDPPQYTSSARVMLDGQTPETAETVTATADAARAIVTSRRVVEDALRAAGVPDDPSRFARESIRVASLGSSSTLQIDVTAAAPVLAADVANGLAQGLVETWPQASGVRAADAIGFLQRRIDGINADVRSLDGRIAALDARLAFVVDPARERALRARRDARASRRDELVQLRLILQTQLGSLLVEQAGEVEPRVLDRAFPASTPDPNHALPIGALGGLVGLIVGIGAAAAVESVRPTLVGVGSIADELDVPVLGILDRGGTTSPQNERLGVQMRLAAHNASVDIVELVSLAPSADLSALEDAVQHAADGNGRSSGRIPGPRPGHLVVRPFGSVRPSVNGDSRVRPSSGLVAVVPSAVKRSRLREVRDLQSVSKWPLIGIVAYSARRWRRKDRAVRNEEAG